MITPEIRKQIFEDTLYQYIQFLRGQGYIPRVTEYPSELKFGIEIELEGSRLPDDIPGWKTHNEGSLRGEAREFVTSGPVSFEGLKISMEGMSETFKNFRTKISKSYRTSTHIHYNVQHKTINDILRSLIVFTCFEPLIVQSCGPERSGNLFCLPSYDCGDTVMWLQEILSSASKKGNTVLNFQLLGRGKYAALNTETLTKFGTLECRVFPSSVQYDQILQWCSWLDNILGREYPNLTQYIKNLEKSPDEEISGIFGKSELPLNYRSLVGFGIEHSWPLAVMYERAVK